MNNPRYHGVAIALHWLIAVAILANLGLGLWMVWALDSASAQAGAISAFQWHKSLGLTVLVLSLLRLAWRLLHPPPPLPAGTRRWERVLAGITHWLLYGLMVAIPLSGWLYVSAQWRGEAPFNIPTLWFGLFEVPHLFGLSETAALMRQQVATVAFNLHGAMALALVILLVLHVGAALKHHIFLRDGVLVRMLPWLATKEQPVLPASSRRPGPGNLAAAVGSLLVAALLVGYGTTTRLAAPERTEVESKASLLQDLVIDSGVQAAAWQVDDERSHIRFGGVHAGQPFEGVFTDWQAAIHFDPRAPAQTFVATVVATASATDGVPLHDRSLPQGEWFDVANHPHASYQSTLVEPLGDKRYALAGVLTIKGQPVALPPLILQVEGGRLNIAGSVKLDRTQVDMGMESDPGAEYVSRMIDIDIDVTATAP